MLLSEGDDVRIQRFQEWIQQFLESRFRVGMSRNFEHCGIKRCALTGKEGRQDVQHGDGKRCSSVSMQHSCDERSILQVECVQHDAQNRKLVLDVVWTFWERSYAFIPRAKRLISSVVKSDPDRANTSKIFGHNARATLTDFVAITNWSP